MAASAQFVVMGAVSFGEEAGLSLRSGAEPFAALPSAPGTLVLTGAPEAPRLSAARPDATFVAQLLAAAQQVPQARLKRRASSADATEAYRPNTYPQIRHRLSVRA